MQPLPLGLLSRRVLMLAYYFPPLGGSGVQRTTKFVKYLPQFGWHPHIVTVAEGKDFAHDPSLFADVSPNTPVLRVADPARGIVERLRVRCRRHQWFATRLLTRGCEILQNPVPDDRLLWSLNCAVLALWTGKASGAGVIYTSGKPFSCHLAGLILKTFTGRPWVADFRDPWTTNFTYREKGLRAKMDLLLERQVLRRADAVVCNHEPMAEEFRRKRGNTSDRVVVITNGYDEEDFVPLAREKLPVHDRNNLIVLAHLGLVYKLSYGPGFLPLLPALEHLSKGPFRSSLNGLRIRFVGTVPSHLQEIVAKSKMSGCFEFLESVSHREAIQKMMASSALLLLLPEGNRARAWYPGKLFEYLCAGRPVFGIGPKGIASALIEEAKAGIWFEPHDIMGISQGLIRLVQTGSPTFEPHFTRTEMVKRYERRRLTAQLAEVFERVTH